jgi:hypothetical protein
MGRTRARAAAAVAKVGWNGKRALEEMRRPRLPAAYDAQPLVQSPGSGPHRSDG